ncbi:MAG: PQQ-dependent sugar dehydrogenase [Gammaproteobacteria bacterium]|nr:PQQ-dependent sugar dehydrogenase [Gammaproteobacteria bacterium]
MKLKTTFAFSLLALLFAGTSPVRADFDIGAIELPDGFAIEEYVTGVRSARGLAIGANGTLFIGTRRLGKVYAVRDPGGPGQEIIEFATGLIDPNGVAVRGSSLFVAEIHRILEYRNAEERLGRSNPPRVFHDGMPTARHHGWRAIGFAPDGWLYVAQGAPCNVCDSYATIDRIPPQGGTREVWARGVRNSVGLAFHPDTGELWFTENGRDLMGDDIPPCELNHAPRAGMHFGFPFCHGTAIPDPDPKWAALGECAEATPPAQELGPHVAPVGLEFYTGDAFPPEYKGRLFIAEHGSWNRSEKIGYRVMMLEIEDGKVLSYEPFAQGWLRGQETLGRPAYVLQTPDGHLLISDDHRGVVYRVRYTG